MWSSTDSSSSERVDPVDTVPSEDDCSLRLSVELELDAPDCGCSEYEGSTADNKAFLEWKVTAERTL